MLEDIFIDIYVGVTSYLKRSVVFSIEIKDLPPIYLDPITANSFTTFFLTLNEGGNTTF